MPKITSVEPQKKSANWRVKRFNIFLDGKFAFGADEDLIVDFRLIPGKEIDEEMLEKLLQEAEVGKLMERMYVLFNIRQRSEKEVRDYLRNLSFKRKLKEKEEISDFVINSIIKKLKRKRMLDDLEFAKSWIESRAKKYGPQRIKQELYKKGVDREIIGEVSSMQVAGYSQEVATRQLEKKMKSWKNLEPLKFKKKSYEYLLRRGFGYAAVKEIIEKVIKKR